MSQQQDLEPVSQELNNLSTMSIDELLNQLVSSCVKFAINLAIAILVFYIGKFIITKLYKLISSILLRRRVDASLSTFILSTIKIILYFMLIVVVIGILGIETSSFLALFASAGVAIGMALSGTLQNFAGGVLILLLKPYRVGDYIEAQGYAGTVAEIQIFHTLITTPDNKAIIIPNGGLSTSSVNNWSRRRHRRVSWTVSISYGDDVDAARKAILDIFRSDSRIIQDTNYHETTQSHDALHGIVPGIDYSPKVVVDQLADSSVNLSARAWVKTPDYWGVYYAINERIYKELPTLAGISFPFPQMDIHVNTQKDITSE